MSTQSLKTYDNKREKQRTAQHRHGIKPRATKMSRSSALAYIQNLAAKHENRSAKMSRPLYAVIDVQKLLSVAAALRPKTKQRQCRRHKKAQGNLF